MGPALADAYTSDQEVSSSCSGAALRKASEDALLDKSLLDDDDTVSGLEAMVWLARGDVDGGVLSGVKRGSTMFPIASCSERLFDTSESGDDAAETSLDDSPVCCVGCEGITNAATKPPSL